MAKVNQETHAALSPTSPAGDGRMDGLYLERATNDIVVVEDGFPVRRLLGPCLFNDFIGGSLDVSAGPWRIKDTSAAGAPTEAILGDADGGQFEFKFAANDEEEILTLYTNDEQNFDPQKAPIAIFRLKTVAQLLATDTLVFGLASAQNDTEDSVASLAWFRIQGANLNIMVESDNGVTDNDDVDTTYDVVADTFYEFAVDATNHLDVRFWLKTSVDGEWTDITPAGTTFKVHATTGLQPFVQIHKSGGAGQTDLLVDYICCHGKRP